LALVRACRAESQFSVVSIFVNPLQFGPNEDFARYPRPFERDRELLAAENVDAVFVPVVEEMYLRGSTTFIEVAALSAKLDGALRPGHFRGVATVVAKLFNIVTPDLAFFGQKDAAQLAVIRRLVRDLDFNVEIRVVPIVRESDGVALSSRNQYLNAAERKQAQVLYRALTRVQALADRGERLPQALVQAGRGVIAEEPGARLDYFAMVDPDTLEPVSDLARTVLVAVAARIGSTRLIDNILLTAPAQPSGPEIT
jgi:pantoate--beta-alanine ligase